MKDTKLYIVGQIPARDGAPFTGEAMARLDLWLGIKMVNNMPQGPHLSTLLTSQSQNFATVDARLTKEGVIALKNKLPSNFHLVCCGRFVGDAMGMVGVPFYKWQPKIYNSIGRTVVIPHPTGASRHWGTESNRSDALRFFRNEIRPLLVDSAAS